jgi:hypothetical protein
MSRTTAAGRLRIGGAALAATAMLGLAAAGNAHADTFTVTNNTEFVNAIDASNARPGADRIVVNAPLLNPDRVISVSGELAIVNGGNSQSRIDGAAVEPFPSNLFEVTSTGDLTLERLTITGGANSNVASEGKLLIDRSSVSNSGLALVAINGGEGRIVNSSIAAGRDFGVVTASTATIVNSTIADNQFGGVDVSGGVTFRNTIIARNGVGRNQCVGGEPLEVVNSISTDATCGVRVVSNAGFATGLINNGGPTPTLALRPDSPAIDAGAAGPCPATDQRGIKRQVGSDACDIGAFELDKAPPVISGATNQTVEATGPNGAVVTYDVTADDATSATVSCAPASGSTFPLGTTQVTCTATDPGNRTSTATFDVRVRDTTAPVISGVPADRTVVSPSGDPIAVTYSAPTATDTVDGTVPVTCDPASGSQFSLGETTVTCTATDAAGNPATASFKVTVVRDQTRPVISNVPADRTVAATSPAGAVVTYTNPTATDDQDGVVAVTCSPASGSTFPIGTTTVTCTTSDRAGNTATASFRVTVTKVPTTLSAVGGLGSLSSVSATLRAGGQPLAGKSVTFRAGSTTLCTATTNAAGVASCSHSQLLAVLLGLGYTATYAGDATYAPASGQGGLLG